MVRRSPQTLILSSPGTTSSGSKAPTAGRTWCAPPRNPLFLRRRAPRLLGPRRRRWSGRGAPRPAIPYSFVAGHHVFRGQGADGGPDVVRPDPQSLILSSSSTTPSGAKAPTAGRTGCAPTRNPVFFRRRAPRLPGPRRRRRAGRGAPRPAIPYSFVAGHHVFRGQGASAGLDVVRRSLQSLIPSSPSTTSSGAGAGWLGGRGAPLPAIHYSFVAKHHIFRGQGADGGKTAPVLAWPDGGIWLCEEPGANMAGCGAKRI